jgi:adenosylcobinamide hydrolase
MPKLFTTASWPIDYSVNSHFLSVQSAQPLAILSSAILSPSFAKTIVNRYVDKNYFPEDPIIETKDWLSLHHFSPTETVSLLTAASVENASVQVSEQKWFRLAVLATAGVGNATRAGLAGDVYLDPQIGTINIILIIDGKITSPAMVNAVITATEAKTAALQDLQVQTSLGHLATGTNTDAIVVAATQQPIGNYLHYYAGVSSPLGQEIGLLTYQAVYEAILADKSQQTIG